MTPFGCDQIRQVFLPYGLNGVMFQVLGRGVELPDSVEHVGRVDPTAEELHAPDIDGPGSYRAVRELATHRGQVAPAIAAPLRRRAAGEIARDVNGPYAAIIVRRVQNSASFVHRKIVGTGSI